MSYLVATVSFLLLLQRVLLAGSGMALDVYKQSRWVGCVQLPATNCSLTELQRVGGGTGVEARAGLGESIRGRRVPGLTRMDALEDSDLSSRAVSLPEANTLAHIRYQQQYFGRLQFAGGQSALFNPEVVLVKFRRQAFVSALRVESGRELEAVQQLAARADVEFAELDLLQARAFAPNDPLLTNQWHHAVLGSYAAWQIADCRLQIADWERQNAIRIAIVDTPFQMDHPDLAAHTVAGWDAVVNEPITGGSGIAHSTLGAGLAAAVINNGVGVAGAANCQVLPINVNGYVSELCNAVYWAASNGVRIVNISWDGADSAALDAAGAYLEANARGLLFMAGLNPVGFLNYPNQPHIWCVAMTDAADNQRSAYGYHIDFAAPGWKVFSTTIGSGYGLDSGTSYAAPLLSGVAALLLSINPTLEPAEVIDILKGAAVDKGEPGWDMWYGWGRIDSAAAARAARATLPVISGITRTDYNVLITTRFKPGLACVLLRKNALVDSQWLPATNVSALTNNGWLLLKAPAGSDQSQWYRLDVSWRTGIP